MIGRSWMDLLEPVLACVDGDGVGIERSRIRLGANTYLVPSFDRAALQFSLPLRIDHAVGPASSDPEGSDGIVAVAVEAIKTTARDPSASALDPFAGRGTGYPSRYTSPVEPYTLIASPSAIGGGLFRAGGENRVDRDGFSLVVSGALPYVVPDDPSAVKETGERLARLADAVGAVIRRIPDKVLEVGRTASLDQKRLRRLLPSLGLVSFVGDGTRPAREYTRFRCHYRVAGPKPAPHHPFRCPTGLDPIDVELPASGERITGLGLRKGEVFAIAGSNAEGKSTFLSAIMAGVDDHLPGDGREHVVTFEGLAFAEAGGGMHHMADLSLFFHRLPPSLSGAPHAASGPGSGSTSMAEEISRALSREVSLLLFDEDRSAVNLLIPSCLTAPGVVPLSTLLASERGRLGDTTVVFTAGALDLLTAEADRIMVIEGFRAGAIRRSAFRRRLASSLRPVLDRLEQGGGADRDDGAPVPTASRAGRDQID
jgi:predicted ABC-class ATPase